MARAMTCEEFNAALRRIGVTPYAAARFLGISASTAQRYANGKVPVSLTVSILLDKIAADYPSAATGVILPEPRGGR